MNGCPTCHSHLFFITEDDDIYKSNMGKLTDTIAAAIMSADYEDELTKASCRRTAVQVIAALRSFRIEPL